MLLYLTHSCFTIMVLILVLGKTESWYRIRISALSNSVSKTEELVIIGLPSLKIFISRVVVLKIVTFFWKSRDFL